MKSFIDMEIYKTLVFRHEARRILGVVQHFDKHCSGHLQGKYVLVDRSWSSYVEQGVEDVMRLIDQPTSMYLP
jgi:hypothetical protein